MIMKNEIKEIIELINAKYKDYYIDDFLSDEDIKKLLDYITDLQEELEEEKRIEQASLDTITNLQDTLKDREEYCYGLETQLTDLQKENDILKKDIEAMKHNYNLLVRLIENGESMTQKFENGLTYQDYKSRNEKALEYIKRFENQPWYVEGCQIKDLKSLLQGDDKE